MDHAPEEAAGYRPRLLFIRLRHYPDGTVVATCRGIAGVGPTERAALSDLADKLSRSKTDRLSCPPKS